MFFFSNFFCVIFLWYFFLLLHVCTLEQAGPGESATLKQHTRSVVVERTNPPKRLRDRKKQDPTEKKTHSFSIRKILEIMQIEKVLEQTSDKFCGLFKTQLHKC